MNKMYLVLGDWSADGHSQTDKVLLAVNKTVEEIQEAYKASCKLTGISFNSGEDYTERKRGYVEEKKYQICCDYEDSGTLSTEVIEILEQYDCPYIDDFQEAAFDTFVDMWFWFVSLSLPGIIYEEIKDEIPKINGYWNKNLNEQFGYGLYC